MLASSLMTAIWLRFSTVSEAWTLIFLLVLAPQAAQADLLFCTDMIPPHLPQNSINRGKGEVVFKVFGSFEISAALHRQNPLCDSGFCRSKKMSFNQPMSGILMVALPMI